MTTSILEIPEIAEGQDDKENTANDAFAALEAAGNAWASVDLTSGNVSMTAGANRETYLRNILLKSTGNAVPRTITLPAKTRFFAVWNGGSDDLGVVVGSTTITIAAGQKAILFADGTTDGLTSILGGSGFSVAASAVTFDPSGLTVLAGDDVQEALGEVDAALAALSGTGAALTALDGRLDTLEAFDLETFAIPIWTSAGLPPEPGDGGINKVMAAFAFRLPTNLAGSQSHSGTNATSSSAFTLKKNGSSIGTITFTSGGSSGALSSSQTDFAAGDRLTIEAPGTQDATLADVGITLLATRL